MVGDTDYCALTKEAMETAMADGGVCASCEAATGKPSGCAITCAGCVNVIESYLSSCADDFDNLNYGIIEGFIEQLAITNDCFDWLNLAARPYAAIYCSDAFDHIVQVRGQCTRSARRAGDTAGRALASSDGIIPHMLWRCKLRTPLTLAGSRAVRPKRGGAHRGAGRHRRDDDAVQLPAEHGGDVHDGVPS
jgi:hypothetical protein